MKRILLFLSMLIFSLSLSAKDSKHNNQLPPTHTSGKTTSSSERLIAYSYRKFNNPALVLDTASFYYSGNRGSGVIDWGGIPFPNPYEPYDHSIKCDSFTSKIGSYTHGILFYDVNNDPVQEIYADTVGGGILTTKDFFFYAYDGIGQILSDSIYIIAGNKYKRYYFYDGSGHLTEDSVYNFTTATPDEKITYINDASGNHLQEMISLWNFGHWVPNYRIFSTFDMYNHLIVNVAQDTIIGSWVNTSKDSIYYPSSGNYYAYQVNYAWASGAWVSNGANSFHLNAANRWDTVYEYSWNTTSAAFVPTEKDYLTYDAYSNLKYAGGIYYDTATGLYADTAYDLNTYYYETYDNTAVNNTTAPSNSVAIYPNPVSDELCILFTDYAAGKETTITITDLLGRCMGSYKHAAGGTVQISTSGLMPGIYIVSVTGDQVHYTQRILKRE